MKRQISSLLLSFLIVASVFAQRPQVADPLEQNLRKHVEYLASDKLEGRRTGEQGATYAAGYVANAFAQFKLKPGSKTSKGKTNFLQPFPYVAGVELGKDNFLRIVPTDAKGENKMEVGGNWMPLGFTPNADIAPSLLVFAGFGISSNELKYDDYAGLDVKDKIVLVFDSTPDAGNPHSEFGRFSIHMKASIAKDKGARAIILIAADSDFKNDRLSRLSYDRTLGETALPIVGVMRLHGAELLGVENEKALADFETALVTRSNKATGPLDQPVALAKAVAQIKVVLIKKQAEAYNVIGLLEGNDPVLKNEAIVIGAHYDHLGRGGQGSLAANSTDIHHGADDNASGTSAVIELARLFAKEKNNKRTIIFMAFGGEEEGLLGSKFYVENPVWQLDKTVAMINLDMVGRLNENRLTVGGIGTANEWKQLIEGRNTVGMHTQGLGHVYAQMFSLQLNEDGFGPSDHSSFYGKKIPVLFLFSGTHLDYHKPSDTADKINYEGLTKITKYVAEIVKSVDQNSQKPTYTTAKASGTPGGRMNFTVSLGTIPSYADSTDGLVLDGVRDNSPASKAGLKAGDKITKLNGKEVRNAMDYTYVLGTMKAGEEYEVEIMRGTEKLMLKIVPAAAARRP
ncbi:MAG: M28 family peptidase [Pyrinomonadaceae bacterium]